MKLYIFGFYFHYSFRRLSRFTGERRTFVFAVRIFGPLLVSVTLNIISGRAFCTEFISCHNNTPYVWSINLSIHTHWTECATIFMAKRTLFVRTFSRNFIKFQQMADVQMDVQSFYISNALIHFVIATRRNICFDYFDYYSYHFYPRVKTIIILVILILYNF